MKHCLNFGLTMLVGELWVNFSELAIGAVCGTAENGAISPQRQHATCRHLGG